MAMNNEVELQDQSTKYEGANEKKNILSEGGMPTKNVMQRRKINRLDCKADFRTGTIGSANNQSEKVSVQELKIFV